MAYAPRNPNGQATKANSSPVVIASDDDLQAKLGATNESAAGSDTATSGLNGLLKRLLQHLTNVLAGIPILPATSGGLSTYHLVSAGSTNATVVKASAGQLFGWYIQNNNASMRKVTFHNASSTPTAGASVFFTLKIPGGAAANVLGPYGIAFSTGIAITTTTDLADNGTTAVAASDLDINLFYK